MKIIRFFFFALALVSIFVGPSVYAQTIADGEYIQQYDVTVDVQKNGRLFVTERIDYYFPEPKHGIYRSIPTIQREPYQEMYLTHIKVTDENEQKRHVKVESGTYSGIKKIIVGDKDKTITGLHT